MVVDPVAGGAVPALDGAAILARTPGLEAIAEVVPVDRGMKPASHFTAEDLLDLAATVRNLVDDPSIDGVVVIQGTDTIEETSFLLDLLVAGPKPIVVTGAMRNATEPDYDGPANLRDAVSCAASPELVGAGTVVVLAGTIEPADDVTKTHATALDTFRSLNLGWLGRIEGGRVVLERPRGLRRPILPVTTLGWPIPIVVATVAMDARILDAAVGLGAVGLVVAATGAGNTSPELLAAGRRAIEAGVPVVLASRAASGAAGRGVRVPRRRRDLGPGRRDARRDARRVQGPDRPGRRPRRRSRRRRAGRLPRRAVHVTDGRPRPLGWDSMSSVALIVEGRIATLAGSAGFGWAEAVAIADGRIVAAGSRSDLEGIAGPTTRRLRLGPDEVAIPGLTDAHLHLADAAIAASHVDLTTAATLGEGLDRITARHATLTGADAWLQGHGWDSDRWGGWPTAADLDRVAPGRRVALWAHDHHSLWVSSIALAGGGIGAGTADPDGGAIRRGPDGVPTGVLHETAARLVSVHLPEPTADDLVTALPALGRALVALGVVGVHDPGGLVPDPSLGGAYVAYARLADRGELPVRVHACLRQEAIETAGRRGLRSGMVLGADPAGRARVGWQKLFADGSLGSRTAAMLDPFEPEPDRPLEPGRERGIWITTPERLGELVGRAAAIGISSQIHAIGDAALRAALDALEANVGVSPLAPRVEHVQLVADDDLGRFARSGIAASVQPVHLRSDAIQARRLWGERAERSGYPWRSLAESGALLPFGTDAPVEPIDPWPGIAIAVTRADPSWPAGTGFFSVGEGLSLARALRAACLDAPLSAGESDRGRLVPGHRADVVVLERDALEEPVRVGGPLGTTRPRLVLVDGEVVFEA